MTDALEDQVPYPSAVPDGTLDRPRPSHRPEHSGVQLATLTVDHWPQIEAIYADGIATGHATFETAPPSWETFDAAKLPEQRIVALNCFGRVLGWAVDDIRAA
ncbi:MAG TPA: hypothetical protein VIU11_10915 [Nakamurella sp.]